MKVLFIGHYREGTGWAQAALDWILSLDAAGVDVVCRPIKLNNNNPKIPERVVELEQKNSKGADYCIQNVLPHLMDYNGAFKKNIGMFFFETLNLNHTGWGGRLATMDEIWVPNLELVGVCNNAGLTDIQKVVVPCATNPVKFEKEYKKYELPEILNHTYKFYFIGEHIRRKRMIAGLIAYYTNFTKYDNVSFIIKSHKSGYSPDYCLNEIEANIDSAKKSLRLYKDPADYPIHCIITGTIEEEELYSIHQQSNCFIMPSFGEGWCIPAFDAAGFGNTVIGTSCGGLAEFIQYYDAGVLVDSVPEPVYGYDVVFDEMNTGFDQWRAISVRKMGEYMRDAYNEYQKEDNCFARDKNNHKEIVDMFSYKNIGEHMKGALLDV